MAHQTLPEKALDSHIAVLGKTGSGKSWRMRGIVERLLNTKKRVCILDPKGDWWGVRLNASGKRAGYPVVIFGGEHADVPINGHSGATVGELVATGNRPCVIDMSTLSIGERTRFFMDFAAAIFKHNKGPLWLVIDEVHNFAPQGKIMDPDAGKMLHWANRLASEGRGKGLRIIMASQRPQKVHKDTLTCAETLVAMRVVHNRDRAAIVEWLEGAGDAKISVRIMSELASMKQGEAWVWSPEIGFLERNKSPDIATYDSMKAPEGGKERRLKGWKGVDLEDVKTRLAEVVREAEANDPKLLKLKITALEKELKSKKNIVTQSSDEDIERAVIKAEIERDRHWKKEVNRVDNELKDFGGRLRRIADLANVVIDFTEVPPPLKIRKHTTVPKSTAEVMWTDLRKKAPRSISAGMDLPKGERKILTAIAQYPDGVTHATIGVLTGYKETSRRTYLQRLSEKGYINNREPVTATEQGVAALGDGFEPLPTGDALREHWMRKLPAGESLILEVLVKHYPDNVSRVELEEETEYKATSLRTYLQRLSARKLVTLERDGAKASELLFD